MRALFQRIRAGFRLVRVYQWTKNGVVLMPLVFSGELTTPANVGKSLLAMLAFCLASGASYIVNDILDLEKDRQHPEKSRRPLARGEIGIPTAGAMAVFLLAAAFLVTGALNSAFRFALLAYIGLSVGYSLLLKNIFLLDVLAISIGFVLRAIAGALAIEVIFSNWLVVCTFFLALFLALGKRRGEINLLEDGGRNHRAVLLRYTAGFIDLLLILVGSGALITYTVYTCSPDVIERIGTDKLYMSLPFVVYGLARYLWLVQQNRAEDPSRVFLKDGPTAAAVGLWALTCAALIYIVG